MQFIGQGIGADDANGIHAFDDRAGKKYFPRGVDGFVDVFRDLVCSVGTLLMRLAIGQFIILTNARTRQYPVRGWLRRRNNSQHGKRKRRRSQNVKNIWSRAHERMEHIPQADVVPHVCFQAGDAVRAENEPDLQGAEAAAEGDLPIPVIGHEAGGGEVVAEVGRCYGEGGD